MHRQLSCFQQLYGPDDRPLQAQKIFDLPKYIKPSYFNPRLLERTISSKYISFCDTRCKLLQLTAASSGKKSVHRPTDQSPPTHPRGMRRDASPRGRVTGNDGVLVLLLVC